jgi:prepilin-type N-terminal cleavage/methylation domain-containing protein
MMMSTSLPELRSQSLRILQSSGKFGFTLIEMLSVLAIVGILGVLTITSVGGIASSYRMSTAGTQLADMFEYARQTALATGVPTRVVVVTDGWSDPARNFRTVNILRREDSADGVRWVVVRRWSDLPSGVSLSRIAVGNGTPLLGDEDAPSFSMTMTEGGQNLAMRFIEFQPSGQVRPELPGGASLILIRGLPEDGKSDNWMEVISHPITGKVSVHRPS